MGSNFKNHITCEMRHDGKPPWCCETTSSLSIVINMQPLEARNMFEIRVEGTNTSSTKAHTLN